MKRTMLTLTLLAAATVARAETNALAAVSAEMDAIREELTELRRQTAGTEEVRRLEAAKDEAAAGFEKARAALPGMADAESALDAARRQAEGLGKRRAELMRKHAAQLEPQRAALRAAEESLRRATLGGERGVALLARYEQLARQRVALRQQAAAAVLPTSAEPPLPR